MGRAVVSATRVADKLIPWIKARRRSNPRVFQSQGFEIIGDDFIMDEERLPDYNPKFFFPVELGAIYDDRYQTITKLGFGGCSTIWLARDLLDHRYVALKFYIHIFPDHREIPFYERLEQVLPSKHLGAANIRKLLGSFDVVGPHGKHNVLVLQPSQMCLFAMEETYMRGRFDELLVRSGIREILLSLDFLHTKVEAIHTGNLLLGAFDDSIFEGMADHELTNPIPRKKLLDRTIYHSRIGRPDAGPLLLSDFGETRLGPGPHAEDIMANHNRAPEIILGVPWSYEVDIWSVGLIAWELIEGKVLFPCSYLESRDANDAHLSKFIAALGPPPQELLKRNMTQSRRYWDEDGNWIGSVPIPFERTLESVETKLEDKTKFLKFMRRALAWDPHKRPTAAELLEDPWILGTDGN
ncbi:hypothetical protein E4U21_001991 [Claviceps maximensis]|nr:hypothetical protein E4U21_001991 [Claviceps maximensis]